MDGTPKGGGGPERDGDGDPDRGARASQDAGRDPVEAAAGGGYDLYEVATWEARTPLDRFAVSLHRMLMRRARIPLAIFAVMVLLTLFGIVGAALVTEPLIGAFVLFSIVPALAIAVYVWRADVTRSEPLGKLLGTFLLGFLFASFAAVVNTIASQYFELIPFVGLALYFFLVVGPVEEGVKLLAVRLYPYPSADFDSVVDGAVYGAVAGLGFATIENAIYIGGEYLQTIGSVEGGIGAAGSAAAIRAFAGPGHVLYSAFAGYYLGLAKFNPDHRGPIVVKGLLIAAGLHALYNTLSSQLSTITGLIGLEVPWLVAFLGFVLVFDGAIAYALYRKIKRYRTAYVETGAEAIERRRNESTEAAGSDVTEEDEKAAGES